MSRPAKLDDQAVAEAVRLRLRGMQWKQVAREIEARGLLLSRRSLHRAWKRRGEVLAHLRACATQAGQAT